MSRICPDAGVRSANEVADVEKPPLRASADIQEWMGHADIQTTMRYLHLALRDEDAALVAEAFALDPRPSVAGRLGTSSPISRDD